MVVLGNSGKNCELIKWLSIDGFQQGDCGDLKWDSQWQCIEIHGALRECTRRRWEGERESGRWSELEREKESDTDERERGR